MTVKSSTESVLNENLVGILLVVLGAITFSAKAVMIKLAYAYGAHVDAISLMLLRMLMALPFFLFVAVWTSKDKSLPVLTSKDYLHLIGLGVIGYYLASYLDFKGLLYISAGLERLILFLYPTFVVILSAIFLQRAIKKIELLALLVSYAGIIFVVRDSLTTETSSHVLLGSVYIVGSALSFAVFLIGSGEMTKRIGSTRFTAYAMTISCLVTIFHYGLVHDVTLPTVESDVYILAFMIAIISTVIPSFLMNAGIRRIGASRASILGSVGPVSTIVLAYFFLNETINLIQAAGTFLVLLGVYIVGRSKSA